MWSWILSNVSNNLERIHLSSHITYKMFRLGFGPFDFHLQCLIYCSIPPRCGWDWRECGPDADGHGGGEDATGEGAGEPRGAAEAGHRQEPDDRRRTAVSFVLRRVSMESATTGVPHLFSVTVISVLFFSFFFLVGFLNPPPDFFRESWRVWETASTSLRLFRRRWRKTRPRSSRQPCGSERERERERFPFCMEKHGWLWNQLPV